MGNDTKCTDSCSGDHGICMDGTCSCFMGWWGDLCEKALEDYYPQTWLAVRIILGVIYFIIFVLGSLIMLKIVRRGELHKPKNRIALHVLGSFVVYYLWTCIMYFVDPFGGDLFPVGVVAFYSAFSVFMGFYFLGAILNYWIQIFHFTKTRLEKEQKLMKINSNYNPQVTIEDIENTLKRMNKWRIPYIVCVSFITLLQIPAIAVTMMADSSYSLVQMVNFAAMLIIYLLFTIAFFVYERNILSLLDKRETKEVQSIRSISRRVRFFSAISVVTVIVSAAYSFIFTSPSAVIVFKILGSLEQFVATNVIYSIYFDFRPSQLRFSLAGLFSDATSEDNTTNSMGMSTNGQDSDVAVVEA